MGIKNKKLFEKMKQHPEDYFNFGFNYKEYSTFLYKHFFMRLER